MDYFYCIDRSCYAGTFNRGPGGSQIGVWGRDECRGSWAVSKGDEIEGTRTSNSGKFKKNEDEKNNFLNTEHLSDNNNKTLIDNFDQNLYCYQVTECVVRPDIELKMLIASAMRVGEVRS